MNSTENEKVRKLIHMQISGNSFKILYLYTSSIQECKAVNHKLNQLVGLLNEKLRLFLSISFGVFLFILFFQPFPLDNFDFNDRLLIVAGFGAIVFLFMFLIQVFLPWITDTNLKKEQEPVLPSYFSSFIILSLSAVAFTFYLRYVGLVPITFYIVFKIILICLAPAVVLRVYDSNKELGQQNDLLHVENKILQKQIEKFEEGISVKTLEILSDNATEKLTFQSAEIAFIKSADNYVEIVYKDGENFKKKLIRNTLKNIEQQTKQFSNFVRCHRTCIVNIHSIEKLHKSYNNHWLIIKGYQEQIPVSRQYMLKLKESL